MKLVLLRHGARSPHDFGDSALNSIGRGQAEALIKFVAPHGPLPAPTQLIASPKRRSKETLAPLAAAMQLPVMIDPRIDERHQHEGAKDFERRTHAILDSFLEKAESDDTVFLCSHLDWLELAVALLPCDVDSTKADWTNCEYRAFRWQDGLWRLTANGVAC